MKVEFNIPKANENEFSKIKLFYNNTSDIDTSVLLNINFDDLYKFTGQRNGVSFDLFLIGCLVYGIDILLSREKFSENHWTRDIEVEFPVESPGIFERGKEDLEQLLSFLTGDNWQISFTQRDTTISLYNSKSNNNTYSDEYRKLHKKVSLFSGGLDSLVGVIDNLAKSKDKIALVSHYDSVFKGAKSDQNKIDNLLQKEYTHYELLRTRVDLSGYDQSGNRVVNESTLRSRSFLFLCQAIFVANSIENGIEVLIPENGTIALNHPLTPSRSSSCSTRTAHPYYLIKIVDFISKLGLNHMIKNEYELKTKGEMLQECINIDLLRVLYKESCSCAKRGTRKDIRDISSGTNHCGVCMPCIYRRVALHSIGLDNEVIGTDIFNPIKYPLNKLPGIPAFLDFIRRSLSIKDIERNLLINGTLPLDKTELYANVVYRTRNQIIDWINNKGSVSIKQKLGLK